MLIVLQKWFVRWKPEDTLLVTRHAVAEQHSYNTKIALLVPVLSTYASAPLRGRDESQGDYRAGGWGEKLFLQRKSSFNC